MKYTELSDKSAADLQAMLKTKKTELFTMKIKQKMMQLTNTAELRAAKKEIARISTAISAIK